MIVFMDTSAVVKRYIVETGSGWIDSLTADTSNQIFIASISEVEVTSAIQRRTLGGSLSRAAAYTALGKFDDDVVTGYERVALTTSVIQRAKQLARKHGLRGYDAVQLATALQIAMLSGQDTITFVCADRALNGVAHAEGLPVENPNDHP
jgi:hypothetical protein